MVVKIGAMNHLKAIQSGWQHPQVGYRCEENPFLTVYFQGNSCRKCDWNVIYCTRIQCC